MNRTTIKTLNSLATMLSAVTKVKYSIESGSQVYGRYWKLTTDSGSVTILDGKTAAELERVMRVYYKGYNDAKGN